MHGTKLRAAVVLAASTLLIGACSGVPAPNPGTAAGPGGSSPPSASSSASSATASPTGTAHTPAPSATDTVFSSPAATPASSSTKAAITSPLTLYYVAIGDGGVAGGEIGCGDSLVATYTEPVTFHNQLRTSMQRLLSNNDRLHGASGLYNALYQSRLAFEAGSVDGDTVTVELSGSVTLGGTCDAPRVQAQLEQTAETAAGTGSARILVEGVPLEEALDGR